MRIGIWGDSIGYGASDDKRGGWASQLQEFVWQLGEHDVYNLSISGENTDKLLKHFDVECVAREPQMVIFAIGVNDSEYLCGTKEPRVSKDKTVENLIQLYDKARKVANHIVFIGLTRVDDSKVQPIPWATEKCYSDERSEKYDKAVDDVAKETGAHFISMRDVVAPEEMPDGLHPGSEGHKKMFGRISEYLISKKLLD